MVKSSRGRATIVSMTLTAPEAPHRGAVHAVSEVATASGVAPSAVRFYEKHGVVRAMRTAGNQRRFDDSAACRIQVAKLAQRVGLTVREIAELFSDLPADPGPEDWARIADQLVVEAQRRVADLQAGLDVLATDTKLCEIGASQDS